MPIYEYACKKCDGEFEVSQRITDEPLKRHLCPHCGKRTVVTKLISRSSFHLKGSGWYMTDYGKNGSKSSDSDDAKSGNPRASPRASLKAASPRASLKAASPRARPKAASPKARPKVPAHLRKVRVRLNRRVLPPHNTRPPASRPSYTSRIAMLGSLLMVA